MGLEDWFRKMEQMGQADSPMEIEGQWTTPRQYYNKKRGMR